MSFTDSNHFSMSLSFSYWNITGDNMRMLSADVIIRCDG